jgi:hypothetical protein
MDRGLPTWEAALESLLNAESGMRDDDSPAPVSASSLSVS